MSKVIYRRGFGLMLGAAIGLAYGLVSQLINPVFLPGIPLYQPPLGPLGNLLLSVLLGAGLGLVSAWASTGFAGVLWSSLLGSLLVSIPTLLSGRSEPEFLVTKITALSIVFCPTAAMLSPLLIVFRWLVDREMELGYGRGVDSRGWQRFAFPVAIILIVGALGLFSQYSDLGRTVTPRMDALIKQGMQAQTIEELPESLRPNDVDEFLQKGRGSYQLAWEIDPTNRYAIPRPVTSQFDQSIVIAHFENGWLLVCLYPNATAEPECRDF